MDNKNTFSNYHFASMLNQYNYNVNPGDIIAGTVFHKEDQGFLVDIGEHIAGYLPAEEACLILNSKKQILDCLVNETREFFIIAYDKTSKQLILSIRRLDYIRAWKRIKQIESEDVTLQLNTEGFNKGGVIILLEGVQGFIPNSHLINLNKSLLLYKKLKCKLLLADEKTNKLILSHKKAILGLYAYKLRTGDIVTGQIINIKSYGIFVKVYGMTALLHISEMKHNYSSSIYKFFHVGENIKVQISFIDLEQGRLYLSTKNLH